MKLIEVPGEGLVEFPSDMTDEEIQSALSQNFPPTGQDIDEQIKADPTWEPNLEQYDQWKTYLTDKEINKTLADRVDGAVDAGVNAAKSIASTVADSVTSYMENMIFAKPLVQMASTAEGAARGTQDLVDLVSESTNPTSPVFQWKAAMKGGGLEVEYDQFIRARKYADEKSKRTEGGKNVLPEPISQFADPKYSEGISLVVDPTLAIPGATKALAMGTKEFAQVAGKGATGVGRALGAIAKPAEAAINAAGSAVDSALGMQGSAKAGQVATTVGGVLAGDAVVAGIPAAVQGTKLAGEALEATGKGLAEGPSRIGPLERYGMGPNAGKRGAFIGAIGRAGGDFSLDVGLKAAQGALEGAALGAGMGYLQGNVEEGIGAGAAAGAMASAGVRMGQKMTGIAAEEARALDFKRYVEKLDPVTKAHFETIAKKHGIDSGVAVMDLTEIISGVLGDIPVRMVNDAEFSKDFGTGRGVTVSAGDRPEIVINVDRAFKGANAAYTLAHEAFHAFGKIEQLTQETSAIRDAIAGRYIKDTIPKVEPTSGAKIYGWTKLQDGIVSPKELEKRFKEYTDKFEPGSDARNMLEAMGREERASYVADELAAEYFASLITGQKPDALLRGFNGLSRQLLDMALTQESSKLVSGLASKLSNAFGVTPTDSLLFKGLKQSSPQLDAMMRGLVRARRSLDEVTLKDRSSVVIKPTDMSNPIAADYAVKMGLAEKTPTGVKWLDNKEIEARDKVQAEELFKTVAAVPNRDGTGARVVDDTISGQLNKEQVAAIMNNPILNSRIKEKILAVSQAIEEGYSIYTLYGAGTKKVKNKLTGKPKTVYTSGAAVSQGEGLPYSINISKAGNPFYNHLNLEKVRTALESRAKEGGAVGPYDSIKSAFYDLAKYLTNLDNKTSARPSVELFGPEKAEWLRNLVVEEEKGGLKFIHSRRLDRTISMEKRNFRAKMSETSYQRSKAYYMPEANDAAYLDAVKRGDMETAQKMVDEAAKAAGYNVGPVWHGSPNKFTKFDHGYTKDSIGFHFGLTESQASGLSGRVTKGNLIRGYAKASNSIPLTDNGSWTRDVVIDEINSKTESKLPYNSRSPAIREFLKKNGFDSVIYENRFEGEDGDQAVILLDPSQIKSADPVTRDDQGNVIPLSKRFNQKSDDIRWLPDVQTNGGKIVDSNLGYRIIQGNKFRLYAPLGSLIGIFDTQAEAERKADMHSRSVIKNRN